MSEIETVAISSPSTSDSSRIVSRGSRGVKEATFYHWKYRHYFEVVDEGDKNLKARCTLCSPSSKPLSCARNTMSNFKKHLDSVHKSVNLVAVLPESVGGGKRKRPVGDNGDSGSKRQATLDRKGVSSVEVRKLVTEYIIDDMLPLTTVESPAFKKLVDELSPHPVQLPDRKTICSPRTGIRINDEKDQGKPGRSRESFHHSRCLDGTPQKLSWYDRPLD